MNLWIRFKEFVHYLPAALVILNPSKGFGLFFRNCVHLDGRLSLERAKAEVSHLLIFLAVMVMVPTFYIGSNILALWTIHKYIVPIPFVMNIFSAFTLGEEAWEAEIEEQIGSMQSMSEKYDQWSSQNGVSPETSKMMQKMLWHSWPLYFFLGLFFAITFYLIVVRFCISTLKEYQRNLIRRKMAYFDRDLRSIPRDQIL